MRIIGSIDHPTYKITLFKTDTRFAIKLENGQLEQTYKVRISSEVSSATDLRKFVDAAFLESINTQFQLMQQNWKSSFQRNTPVADDDEFDAIV